MASSATTGQIDPAAPVAGPQPHSGEILFDGQPLPAWGNREFARQVAYLPQHLPSAETLLGRRAGGDGPLPWRLACWGAEDHRQVSEPSLLTTYRTFADRLVDTLLRGGERGESGWRCCWRGEPLHPAGRAAGRPGCRPIRWSATLVRRLSRQPKPRGYHRHSRHQTWPPTLPRIWLVALHSGRLLTQCELGIMTRETPNAIYGVPWRSFAIRPATTPSPIV